MLTERNLSEDNWRELSGFIEFAINFSVADGTGQVPAELTIGELPCSPLDVVVQAGGHAGGTLCSTCRSSLNVLGITWRRQESTRKGNMIATTGTRSMLLGIGSFSALATCI